MGELALILTLVLGTALACWIAPKREQLDS